MDKLLALSLSMLALGSISGASGAAGSSSSSFNPGFLMEDLLSYPQYDMKFLDDLLPASQLQSVIDKMRQDNERKRELKPNAVADQKTDKETDKETDTDMVYEPIVLKATKKWKFLCRVPKVDSEKVRMEEREREDTAVPSGVDARVAERESIERGLQLLEPMKTGCLTYVEGWWTFEYCHDKSISQFHRIEQADPNEYELIKYRLGDPNHRKALSLPEKQSGQTLDGETESTRTTQVKRVGRKQFLTQTWGGGSLCEITRRPREIEVQFHCDPNMPERISHIKETSTCQYFMVVTTPRLCEDPSFFDPAASTVYNITCQQVVGDKEYHEIMAQKALLPETAKEQPTEPVPGDLERDTQKSVAGKKESGTAKAKTNAKGEPKKKRKKSAKKAAAEPETITIDLSDPEQIRQLKEKDEEVRRMLAQLLGEENVRKLLPRPFEESSNRKQLMQDLEKDEGDKGSPQQKRTPELAVRGHDEL